MTHAIFIEKQAKDNNNRHTDTVLHAQEEGKDSRLIIEVQQPKSLYTKYSNQGARIKLFL